MLLDLRGRIFRHAQALSVDFHERYTSGRLISRATTDVESLRELLSEGLEELLGVALSVVYISVTLLYLDGLGGAAVLSFWPLYLLIRSFQRRSMRVYRKRSTAIAAVIVTFTETMNGIRPVQAFRREHANDTRFRELNHRHERANGDAILEMARYVVSSRLVANAAVAVLVLWGAYRVASGSLALGVLAAAALYLRRLYDPIDRLGMFLNSTSRRPPRWRRSRAAGPAPLRPRARRPQAAAAAPDEGPRPGGGLRRGALRLSHRRRGAAPLRPHAARRADPRGGRGDRRGQVHPRQAAGPFLDVIATPAGPGPLRASAGAATTRTRSPRTSTPP
ncbi:hypothetical protein SANTM175S_00640 [Streptomyces antimycoticus]